jgi:hypothetical protein
MCVPSLAEIAPGVLVMPGHTHTSIFIDLDLMNFGCNLFSLSYYVDYRQSWGYKVELKLHLGAWGKKKIECHGVEKCWNLDVSQH